MIRKLILIITIFFCGLNFSFASHSVGGSLGYEYIGVFNGYYRYKIILTTYTNAETSGPNAANPPYWNGAPTGNQEVWIFAHDAFNDPDGGASTKSFIQTLDLVFEYDSLIEPEFPSACTFSTSARIYKGVYSATVDLGTPNPATGGVDPSFFGYHIVYERCCRNNGIVNLDNNSSSAYYAYIPSDLLGNSSPVFTKDPLPFLCINDTNSLLNSAYDPDGDELVFSLVRPYEGNQAGPGNPQPNPPGNGLYNWPINEVIYEPGYSEVNPFGTGGYDYISASSGLTEYYSNSLGLYVIAVEIKEIRNGVTIGITRRDIQIQFLNCPPNNAVNLNSAPGLNTSSSFSTEEGETLCFDFGFIDNDLDSISVICSGQILDSNIINPYATVTPNPAVGNDTVSSTFCWQTGCDQDQNLPYFFQISATDNGCPPKTTNFVYDITVTPTNPPANIYGDLTFCQNSITTYTTDINPTIQYSWSVDNKGTILQNFGDSVQVLWNSPGTGTIYLSAINQYGCQSDSIFYNATITPAPTVEAGNDVDLCFGDSVMLIGSTNANPGYIASWQSTGPISSPNSLQTYVNPNDTTTYLLLVDIGGGCFGIDSVKVNVAIANVDAGVDETICLGDSVNLIANSSATNFSWSPNSFIDQPNNFSTNAWPNASTQYIVEATTANGCTDRDTLVVFVSPLPGSSPNFILNGSATSLGNNTYQMTTAIINDFASIWNNSMIDLSQSFQIDAELNFGTKDATGADGMAFVLQQTSTTYAPSAANNQFAIIDPSLIVEFDTWNNTINNDIVDDHIAILKDGSSNHNINSLLSPVSLGNIEDGAWHTTTINWDPLLQNFTVDFDGVQVATLNYDIVQNIFNNNSAVYWGFTATTGGSNNNQSVRFTNTSTFNPISDLVICETDSVTISSPVSTNSYLWSPNVSINDNTIESPNFNPSTTTTYYFTGTNSLGCFIQDTFQITVNDLPTVNAGIDQTVCTGDSVTLNASGNALNFAWDNGVNDGVNFEITSTLDYILTGISSDGCINSDTVTINALAVPNTFNGEADGYINLCINDSVQLQGQGADVYSWTPSTFLSDPNIATPWATPSIPTQYILTGSLANGCSNTDTLQIDVNQLPVLSTGADQTICEGDSTQIEAFGGVNFNWITTDSINNPSVSNPIVWPTITTTYKVLVSDLNTCEDTAEVTVFVNPKPIIEAGLDQNICIGDSTSLNASGSAISYSWNNGISDGVLFQVNQTQDYILTGVDVNSCVNSDTVSVNILSLPTIDAGSTQTICLGDSTQIIATGGANYIWTPNTNITDNSTENPFVFPIIATDYFVIGTDSNGCQNIDSVSILINSLPSIGISNDTAICIGDSININASGGIQYEWLNTDSINNTTISNPDIWPSATSIYDVLVTNSNNCKDTAQINITVNSLPNINLATDIDLCIGDTAQITVSGAISYLWSPNNNISPISSNSPEVWPNDTTNYIVFGTDANQCSNSDSIRINVLNLPIADAGADLWICPGGSISLNANGGTNYEWSPDSTLNNGSLQNPLASPVNDETYIVTVTDNNNCINTDTLFLAVEQNVPTDAGGINDTLNICEGLTQVLGASPTSPNGSTYQWNPTSTLTSPNSSNPTAQPLTPSWYTVESNNDTCSGVDSVFVNFFPSLIASSGSNQQICIGDSTSIVASGGNTYNWSPVLNASGDTILINDSINNPQVFPIDTTTFYVTITDTNGCLKTDSTIIIVNPLPNFDLGSNTSLCLNDSLNLLASGGNNYVWMPNYNITNTSIANPIVFNIVDTTYFVTVTDSNSCINSDSINISVNPLPTVNASANDTVICYGSNTLLIGTGALSYVWSPTDSLSNPNIPFPSANPDTSTLFTLIGTDANGCGGIDSVNITVLPLPIVDAGEDSIICPGLSVQLSGSGGLSYQWLNPINLNNFLIANPIATPDTITTYILQATDLNGCINTDTAIIYLYEPANANAGFNLSICLDESVLLTASGGVSYNWEPSNFVNRPDTSIVLATPNDDMEFIVEVIDTNGCIDFDTIQVQVFIANSIGDTLICKGDSVQANIFGDPGVEFSWTPTNGVSDSSIFNPYLSPMNTTTYLLDITNASGCVITDTIMVVVPDPIASFDTTLQAGCNGVVVNYINTSNSDLNINWIFSNGESSILNEVEKEFTFNEDYIATLNVEDQYGCTNSVTVTGTSLTFDDYFSIYKPNVFTPNGDGENDEFIIDIPGKLYECTDLVIYNRWGQIQFMSTGNNIRWDGRNNVGQIAPNGTYFYTLTIKDKEYGGSLNLYR